MVSREHVEKDHDCAGRYITGQRAWDCIVEAEEKEGNLRAQVDIPCKATYFGIELAVAGLSPTR